MLPATKFFRPKKAFFDFMRRFSQLHIYDVGSGVGHVSRRLWMDGYDVTALDMFMREDVEFAPRIANGYSFQYDPGSLVMMCRPCHGSFVLNVFERAFECECKYFLYVGLERNLSTDFQDALDWLPEVTKKAVKNVGEDGEIAILVDLDSDEAASVYNLSCEGVPFG